MNDEPTDPGGGGTFPGSPDLRSLRTHDGRSWIAYRRALAPRYLVAWREIATCHLMIFGAAAGWCWVNVRLGNLIAVSLAPVVGAWIGYWLHPLMLFGHEAAHYHLAPSRVANDRLANWLVMSLLGLDIALYRKIHWIHHRHLGDPNDSEISYHTQPSSRFLVLAFAGLYPLKKLVEYYRTLNAGAGRPSRTLDARHDLRWFLALARTAVIHGAILAVMVMAHLYGAALAWLLGLVVFFPAFNMLRQILEHRGVDAQPDVDYTAVAHGPVNRMFPTGWLSRTFGAAGFNRHLLHHWDPGISYTRFDEMEAFLLQADAAMSIEAARSTYFATLRSLIGSRNAG